MLTGRRQPICVKYLQTISVYIHVHNKHFNLLIFCAPKLPFSHINIGSLKKKCDSGPFRGSPGRNAFRETAENGQRPLGETALPGRLCTNLKNPNGSNDRNSVGFEPVYPVFCVGGLKRALLALFSTLKHLFHGDGDANKWRNIIQRDYSHFT